LHLKELFCCGEPNTYKVKEKQLVRPKKVGVGEELIKKQSNNR